MRDPARSTGDGTGIGGAVLSRASLNVWRHSPGVQRTLQAEVRRPPELLNALQSLGNWPHARWHTPPDLRARSPLGRALSRTVGRTALGVGRTPLAREPASQGMGLWSPAEQPSTLAVRWASPRVRGASPSKGGAVLALRRMKPAKRGAQPGGWGTSQLREEALQAKRGTGLEAYDRLQLQSRPSHRW